MKYEVIYAQKNEFTNECFIIINYANCFANKN